MSQIDTYVKSLDKFVNSDDFDRIGDEMACLKHLDCSLSAYFPQQLQDKFTLFKRSIINEFLRRNHLENEPFLANSAMPENLEKIRTNMTILKENKAYFERAFVSYKFMANLNDTDMAIVRKYHNVFVTSVNEYFEKLLQGTNKTKIDELVQMIENNIENSEQIALLENYFEQMHLLGEVTRTKLDDYHTNLSGIVSLVATLQMRVQTALSEQDFAKCQQLIRSLQSFEWIQKLNKEKMFANTRANIVECIKRDMEKQCDLLAEKTRNLNALLENQADIRKIYVTIGACEVFSQSTQDDDIREMVRRIRDDFATKLNCHLIKYMKEQEADLVNTEQTHKMIQFLKHYSDVCTGMTKFVETDTAIKEYYKRKFDLNQMEARFNALSTMISNSMVLSSIGKKSKLNS